MSAPRPMPFGFAVKAHRPNKQLIAEFHCSSAQIKRWRDELGINVRRTKAGRQVWQIRGNRIVNIHRSMVEAARAVNGDSSNICLCAQGKIPSAYGYKWRYAE